MLSKLKNREVTVSDGAKKQKIDTAALRVDRDLADLHETTAAVPIPNALDMKTLVVTVAPPTASGPAGRSGSVPGRVPHRTAEGHVPRPDAPVAPEHRGRRGQDGVGRVPEHPQGRLEARAGRARHSLRPELVFFEPSDEDPPAGHRARGRAAAEADAGCVPAEGRGVDAGAHYAE